MATSQWEDTNNRAEAGGNTGTDKVAVQAVEARHHWPQVVVCMCTPSVVGRVVSAKAAGEHWEVMDSLVGDMSWSSIRDDEDMQTVFDSTMASHTANNVGGLCLPR